MNSLISNLKTIKISNPIKKPIIQLKVILSGFPFSEVILQYEKTEEKKICVNSSRTYVSQFPDLATETGDLVVQIAVHRINPQLDFFGISHRPRDKTFPACNSPKSINHTLTNAFGNQSFSSFSSLS